MLIVMLVLLVVTASATMALYSSQLRARGKVIASGDADSAVAQSGLAAASTTIECLGAARALSTRCSAPLVGIRVSLRKPAMNRDAEQGRGMTSRSQRFSSIDFAVGSGAAGSNRSRPFDR